MALAASPIGRIRSQEGTCRHGTGRQYRAWRPSTPIKALIFRIVRTRLIVNGVPATRGCGKHLLASFYKSNSRNCRAKFPNGFIALLDMTRARNYIRDAWTYDFSFSSP